MTKDEAQKLWTLCLADIEPQVSKANFSTWFKHTHIHKEEGGVIAIGVPNEFVKDWLFQKYHKLISKTITTHHPSTRGVEYCIAKYEPRETTSEVEKKPTTATRLPLENLYINKDDNLNPRYTFDTAVIGGFNELAYAAGRAIVDRPGIMYNPFFIYGGTGLGKTHLIQSIGNAIKKNYPDKKVFYTSLDRFYMDFVNSTMQNKVIPVFKEKYRKYDVLIIDDIQFIANKEGTQQELFHVFNALYDQNKQIIFSSDKHPNFIPNLEDRLRSRFSQGMIVDISEPEYESRVAILKSKSIEQEVSISNTILEYIAENVTGNIRELEGILNAVIGQMKLKNKELSINDVKQFVKNNIKPKKGLPITDVVKVIAGYYAIEEADIYDKTRRKDIVKARQVIMYILREDFNISFPLIGQKLGGKDHTTVIHSHVKIKEELKTDQSLLGELEELRAMLK